MSALTRSAARVATFLDLRAAIGLAVLAAFIVLAPACGDNEENGTPAATSTITLRPTPGLPPETLFSEEFNGVMVQLEYQPMAIVYATTPQEYREAKAALEERLPSLVPYPCLVRWMAPVLQMVLEPDDYVTSGCQ